MSKIFKPTKSELKEILAKHFLWLNGNSKGVRADLRGAYLREADLERANLVGAYLREADLKRANLVGANLRGADLTNAYFYKTKFDQAIIDNKTKLDPKIIKENNFTYHNPNYNQYWAKLNEI